MDTHRTIFVLDTPFLDAWSVEVVDTAFERYLKSAPLRSRVPVDFHSVQYMSSAIGIICMAMTKGFEHVVVCMRMNPNCCEVVDLTNWNRLPCFDFTTEGECPSCGGDFDHTRFECVDCGAFEQDRVVWRPKR